MRAGVAVVTGAARGIGRAIAERLGGDGHLLVLVDLSPALAETALELETAGAAVVAVEADLTSDEGIAAVVREVGEAGGLDILVNNAGITRDSRLVNMTDEDFVAVIDVNLGAPYRLTRALHPHMHEGAAVVNIASRAYLGNFGQFNYSMSKGGLVGMTRALALEFAPRVRVSAVAPGLIGTEMAMAIPSEVRAKMVSAIPLGRMGEPSEVADVVAFLTESGYVTGEVIVVGGGRSLS